MGKKIFYAICQLGLAMAIPMGLWGQGGVTIGEQEMSGDWKPNLGSIEKPEDQVTPIDNKVETKEMIFYEKQIKAPTRYQPQEVNPPAPPKPPMDQLQNNLFKLSFGRFASPYAKLFMNTGRKVDGRAGLEFSHASSSKGYIDYAEWRDDILGGYGEYYTKTNTFKGAARFQNANYFYFADTTVRSNPELKDSVRNTYSRIQADMSVASNYNPDGIQYEVGLQFQGYFDRWKDQDLHLSLAPKLAWKITDMFGADVTSALTFSNSTFGTVQQSRFFLDLTPTASFKREKLSAQAGLKVNSFTDSTTKFRVFPVLRACYQLIPERLSVVGGVGGEMHYLKYYDLIVQNKYLDRMPDIRPMRDAIHLYLCADGHFAKYFTFSTRVYTKKVKDQLIYYSPEGGAYFQMRYDSNFTQSGVELSLIFNKNDKIRAGIRGDLRAFNTSNVAYNFNIPGTRIDLWGSYNFANKIWVASEIYLFGPRTMSMRPDSSGAMTPIKQGVVADVNLSAEYRFSKRISVFLEFNNLLNNRWQRLYNYQERPFDIKAGATFSF
ncbi:MAG: hypothetical protein RLZZ165_1776 [Bacteroidota bacterium]|jgi:hypothetical protein